MKMKKLLSILGMAMTMVAISSSVRDLAAQPGHYKTQPSRIVRLDPAFDRIVPKDAVLEKIADGFAWVEGPVWNRAEGYLLFSDIPNNAVMKWNAKAGASLFLKPSGYTGAAPFAGVEPGSNGLTFDREGRLVLCEHGDRRVSRLEKNGTKTTLADRYQGKRLNSPNDVVFKSNGDMYFTDPPFGLPKAFDDPAREMDFCGVYRLSKDGKLTLLTKELGAPNGIAFSPDEKKLYLSDYKHAAWLVYEVKDDGTIANGRMFYEAAEFKKNRPGSPDGMKVDVHGNIFGGGPGGIYVFSPEGKHLGTFDFGVPTGNCNWGEDGSTLFITSNTAIYRIRLNTKGAGF
jgi:gluconolactonase